jgi:DNA-binding transcriptional ArsR family regulator
MSPFVHEELPQLERLFHEPNRMAILSTLCAATGPMSFTDLKSASGLTDGNLSRHLKALQEAGIVRVKKTFVGVKPRTTVSLTEKGLKRFDEYLVALSEVLKRAKYAMASERKSSSLLQAAGILSPA